MYPRVLREVARVGEGLVALRAFVRLRLPHVDLRVHLQVRLRTEDLQGKGDGKLVTRDHPRRRRRHRERNFQEDHISDWRTQRVLLGPPDVRGDE